MIAVVYTVRRGSDRRTGESPALYEWAGPGLVRSATGVAGGRTGLYSSLHHGSESLLTGRLVSTCSISYTVSPQGSYRQSNASQVNPPAQSQLINKCPLWALL
jgi:hypothetical protein